MTAAIVAASVVGGMFGATAMLALAAVIAGRHDDDLEAIVDAVQEPDEVAESMARHPAGKAAVPAHNVVRVAAAVPVRGVGADSVGLVVIGDAPGSNMMLTFPDLASAFAAGNALADEAAAMSIPGRITLGTDHTKASEA